MEDLRAWYLGTLSEAISSFLDVRRELAQGSPDAGGKIRDAAHPLRGSGGTYGFPAISVAAAAVEDADDAELLPRLDALLTTLAQVVADSGSGPAPGDPAAAGTTTPEGDSVATPEADSVGSAAASLILVVEDDPSVAQVLQSELAGTDREVLTVGTALEAREIIGRSGISLIILDLVLPDGDGRTLLMSLRSRPATASVPIIVLSVRGGAETEAECLTLGAAAFFEKPLDVAPFRDAVSATLQEASSRSEHVRRDHLTGLPNRADLRETFIEGAPGRDRGAAASLALVDLDRFRAVNDSCGARTGDKVLAHVASTLGMAMRAGDIPARWQGDRFAVLFPGTDTESARTILSGARAMMRRTPYDRERGGVVDVTFSAGLIGIGQGETLEAAVSRADHLLYVAKATGRDRIVAVDDEVSMPHRTVLLAEDDDATARIVQQRLEREGFEVLHCGNGEAALEASQTASVDLFLLDVRMPVIDGFELLERLRKEQRFATTPIIMLTSLGSEEYVARGHALGANDYIVKPVNPDEVVARVQKLLGRWVTGRLDELEESELYAAAVKSLDQAFEAVRTGEQLPVAGPEEVAGRLVEALSANGNDLLSQVAVPDTRGDDPILRHSVNVAVLAVCVGSEMKLADDDLRKLGLAGLLHEIGRLRLPEELQRDSGVLSDADQGEIRKRPEYGHETISALGPSYEEVAETVLRVHERLDGSGYPGGLKSAEIPTEAQILGAVDAFEARTHVRAHRGDALTAKEAFEELLAGTSTAFSKAVVKAMIDRLGLFPIGTYVELVTGEIGQVMEARHDNPIRPLVAVMRDSRGRPLREPRIVDLKMSTQNSIKGPVRLGGG